MWAYWLEATCVVYQIGWEYFWHIPRTISLILVVYGLTIWKIYRIKQIRWWAHYLATPFGLASMAICFPPITTHRSRQPLEMAGFFVLFFFIGYLPAFLSWWSLLQLGSKLKK